MTDRSTDLIIYSNMLNFCLTDFAKDLLEYDRCLSFWIFPDDLSKETGRKIEKIAANLVRKGVNFLIYPLPLCLYRGHYPRSIRSHIIQEKGSLPPAFLNEYGIKHVHTKEDMGFIEGGRKLFEKCYHCSLRNKKCRGIFSLWGSSRCEEKLRNWLHAKTDSMKRGNLLDCGCGVKPNLLDLYKEISQRNNKIFLVDPSLDSLASLRQRTLRSYKNIFLVQSMAEKMAFKDNFFDITLLISTYSHLRNLKASLDNIRKSLKTNGLLLVSDSLDIVRAKNTTKQESSIWNNHFRDHNFNQTVLTLERNGFKVIDTFNERLGQAFYWVIKAEKKSLR